ncbi:MAG TPA: DUF1990 domain-containing protein [Vicinamibacterales bacterium]|nr:DUF1990 domain-containing protein [Vicinamibacterales bacterium]
MFSLRRPSDARVARFLEDSASLPLSYSPIGLAQNPRRGFAVDVEAALIGHGETDFERARRALGEWRHFDLEWVELFPKPATIEPGTVVAVLVRHLGFWSLNGCRVLYHTLNDDGTAFGFAYGTLPGHAECGEELFTVSIDPPSGSVSYTIQAVAHPSALLAQIGYPFTRSLQARFRKDSAMAMARTIGG